ncbi:PilZ domain-containing protein [Croceicoccus naphthovorans]|nr:PilZ domain-containing protein [Croceicoccus naphthovorans]MBB3991679.1 hypothetical protein [Croceicoccus naphthovorans]
MPDDFFEEERRGEVRTRSVYRPALIQTEDFSGFCMIRDISPIGVRVEAFAAIVTGQDVIVQFSDTFKTQGRVIWNEGTQIGISFKAEIDTAAVLTGNGGSETNRNTRPLRLDVECDASVQLGSDVIPVKVRDISQRGIKIAASGLSVGASPLVIIPGIEPKRATVTWTQYGICGLHFNVPMRYDELASWAVRIRTEAVE